MSSRVPLGVCAQAPFNRTCRSYSRPYLGTASSNVQPRQNAHLLETPPKTLQVLEYVADVTELQQVRFTLWLMLLTDSSCQT
jgi:hypothetical protein